MLHQLRRLVFLSLANKDTEETWTLQKQTFVAGKRVESRESSWGGDMMQIHPCSTLALLCPSSLCGVFHYIFWSGFLCNQHLVGWSGEGSEAGSVAMQKYGLILKHGICQTELAFSVVLGALGEFVGGLCPAHRISGGRWCPGAVLGWMGSLRPGWCEKDWGRLL